MTIKAFIFDLDGVITDTAEYHYLAWKRLADSLNIPFDRDDNEQMKGLERMASLEKILVKSKQSFSDVQRVELATQKNGYYLEFIGLITPKDILPGVLTLLDDLRRGNYRIGLASASKNAALVLDRLGIADKFEYVADANYITNAKPDPEVFINVMEHFSLTPQQCIGIEDAYLGVQAINSAKMFAVGIGSDTILNNADVVYADMKTLDLSQVLALAS